MGGDADTAYRIARCLQFKYEQFSLYVWGYCKSAGTLVATGANELILSDYGELGPLDVQMFKRDELGEMQSGLTVMDTLTALQDNALMTLENFFLNIKSKGRNAITLKTATQIATELTTGLFAPLYSQVDPLHVGEAGRALTIASNYGNRLLSKGSNIEPSKLDHLISHYPVHSFVIDLDEAKMLFNRVREPTQLEILLAEKLIDPSQWPNMEVNMPLEFLSTELSAVEGSCTTEQSGGSNDVGPGNSEGFGLSTPTGKASKEPAGSDDEEEALPTLSTAS